MYTMKKAIISTVVLALLVLTACSQNAKKTNVPAIVQTSFTTHFAGAKAEWEEEDSNYEAEFEKDGKEMSAVFDKTGALLETETEIPADQLPAAALAYIKQHHADAKVKEAAKITDAKGVVTYEAEVKGKDLIFDASGNFVKEVK